MRSNFNRRATELLLLRIGGGSVGSGRKNESSAGKKNYADWSGVAAVDGFHSVGGSRSHIDGTFFSLVGMFHCVLPNFARGSGLRGKGVNLWNILVSVRLCALWA